MPAKRLPPKCHVKDGRYYYVDKNKWLKLSRVDEGLRALHSALAKITHQPPSTMAGIFAAFIESPEFAELAPSTQGQYDYFYAGILGHRFGHLMPSEIQIVDVAKHLKLRKKQGHAPSGNRERAALSSAFEFALGEGLAKFNPCRGCRKLKEKASAVYIASEDLRATIDKAPDHFARLMQLAYMTGMRATDLRALKVSDVTPEGLMYTESKTGKRVAMAWTDTLRGLIREILEARTERMNRPYANKYKKPRAPIEHDFLMTNRLGKPVGPWGIISNVRRLKTEGWTFRAIRPKAQTDAGDERNVLGHTGRMREVYTRRRKLVPVQ